MLKNKETVFYAENSSCSGYALRKGTEKMKRKSKIRLISVILAVMMIPSLLSGCGGNNTAKEDEDTITVYMWSNSLYNSYAPYI